MKAIFERPELMWFLLGLVLFLLELVVPGFIIFFFGVGAWVTALICLITSPGTNLQIIIFGVASLLSLIALRRLIQKKFFYNRGTKTVDIEDEFTGKAGIAITDFGKEAKGKVEFKGTRWDAESEYEIKEGQQVVIIKKSSLLLTVEPKK
jgi:inner membrane protein